GALALGHRVRQPSPVFGFLGRADAGLCRVAVLALACSRSCLNSRSRRRSAASLRPGAAANTTATTTTAATMITTISPVDILYLLDGYPEAPPPRSAETADRKIPLGSRSPGRYVVDVQAACGSSSRVTLWPRLSSCAMRRLVSRSGSRLRK